MFDKNSPIPLYLQLKNELMLKIKNDYDTNDLFLNEPQIQKEFGVSRITVRKAMELLANEGLVVKERGRGTFVKKDKLSISNADEKRIHSWKEDVKKAGMEPTNKIIDISKVKASKAVAARLDILPEADVIRIQRLCYADGKLIMMMTNYVNYEFVDDDFKMINDSLYYTLENIYKVNIERSVTTVEARMPSAEEIKTLELNKNVPVLDMCTIAYDNYNRIIETTDIVANSDRYKFIAG